MTVEKRALEQIMWEQPEDENKGMRVWVLFVEACNTRDNKIKLVFCL